MFSAVLVVCSLTTPACDAIAFKPVYSTEAECIAKATDFATEHAPDIAAAYGKFEVAIWCRSPKGGKPA